MTVMRLVLLALIRSQGGLRDSLIERPPYPMNARMCSLGLMPLLAACSSAPLKDYQETPSRKNELITVTHKRLREHNVPLNFYGKVVDQNGAPVAGVEVKAAVRLVKEPLPGIIGDGFDYLVASTASDGTFAFLNRTGEFFGIDKIQKEGYLVSATVHEKTYYYYASDEMKYRPNPSVPEVFKIWKQMGAEELIEKNLKYKLTTEGRSYGLDLLNGAQAKAYAIADIRVSMTAPSVIKPHVKYDWNFVLEAAEGGLIETSDDYMYLAPVDGYVSRIQVSFNASDANWSDNFRKRFYVMSRNGSVYARIEILVGVALNGHGYLHIESASNPNSSRNLESKLRR